MRALIELLRISLVSPECLFFVTVGAISFFWPTWFSCLGTIVARQPDVLKWLPVIPGASCALAIQWAWKLTTPVENSGRTLLDWPDYWKLKLRRNYSLALSFLTAVLAVVIWVFAISLTSFELGLLITVCFGLAIINAACMVIATLTLREIIEQ